MPKQNYYTVLPTSSQYEPSLTEALKHKALKTIKQPLKSSFGLMQIGFGLIIIYAIVLTNQGIDYKTSKPIVAHAQEISSQPIVLNDEIVKTVEAVEVKPDNHKRVLDYISKYNSEEAEDMTTACLKMSSFDICRLSLAIAFKESKVSNNYTIATMNPAKGLIWQRKIRADIVNVIESDNQELAIRYNLWGVKYSEGRGGNYIQYIDINSGKTFFGSIVGYKTWDQAFTDHNRVLTKTYGKHTQDEITKEDIAGIASRYLTGDKKSWTNVVFDQFNSI